MECEPSTHTVETNNNPITSTPKSIKPMRERSPSVEIIEPAVVNAVDPMEVVEVKLELDSSLEEWDQSLINLDVVDGAQESNEITMEVAEPVLKLIECPPPAEQKSQQQLEAQPQPPPQPQLQPELSLIELNDEYWASVLNYLSVMEILYAVMAYNRLRKPAEIVYQRRFTGYPVTVTPFKIEISDVAYPASRLADIFYVFGAMMTTITFSQSEQFAIALEKSGRPLSNVHRLALVDMRLTTQRMVTLSECTPKVRSIYLNNVAGSALRRFNVHFEYLESLTIVDGRKWFDFILANKQIKKLKIVINELPVVTVVLDEKMIGAVIDMPNLKRLTIPANLFKMDFLVEMMKRSKPLRIIVIKNMAAQAVSQMKELLPSTWYILHVEKSESNRKHLDCKFVRSENNE